ncbi:MAG TPA: cytochrome c biogenesis protein CcsA [Thermodesulfobacteriota bacterium]|nr:cytochrome c biogenesis protein CcsA [Thermodesulfobacteriota bacterium]
MSNAALSLISFYLAFGGYFVSTFFCLLKKERAAEGFFVAGFIFHTVSQINRGWYLGFFYPHPMFNEISFLPWCLGFAGLIARSFKKDIKLFPHIIIPVLFFSLITLVYPKGVIPPIAKNQTFFSPLFFAAEVLAHACFIMGGWLAFFFVRKKIETSLFHDSVIWGFVLYSLAQVFGAIWAYLGWGSPFHWADKHLGSAAIWCYYAAYIHLSFVAQWDLKRRAGIVLLGVLLVLAFSFDYQLAELIRMVGGKSV